MGMYVCICTTFCPHEKSHNDARIVLKFAKYIEIVDISEEQIKSNLGQNRPKGLDMERVLKFEYRLDIALTKTALTKQR